MNLRYNNKYSLFFKYKKNRIFLTRLFVYIYVFFIIISFGSIVSEAQVSNVNNKDAAGIAGNASSTDAVCVPGDAPEINAVSAIVMDVDTGDILYEKSPHERLYPASITKVLTCLLAIEKGNVNDTLTISDAVMNQVEAGSSSIGLVSGEQLSLRDALYGMMLNSGNECALAMMRITIQAAMIWH